jgi:uncharacterized delta-60 repeat protein
MLLPLTQNRQDQSTASGPRRHGRKALKQLAPRTRLSVEALEDRCLLSAGALDLTFGSGGLVTTSVGTVNNSVANGVAIYHNDGAANEGKIVAAGTADVGTATRSNLDFAVVRYNANGSPDAAFGNNGVVTTGLAGSDHLGDVAIQPDGKIVAAGSTYSSGQSAAFALVRYTVSGKLDKTFGGSGKVQTSFLSKNASADAAYALVIQADGKIVEAGSSSSGITDGIGLARYNADGSLDITFNGTGLVRTSIPGYSHSFARDVTLDQTGRIVVAGYTRVPSGENSPFVARYNANGSLDTSFGGTGIVVATQLHAYWIGGNVALQSDGKIVVGWVNGLARYNPDGSLDDGSPIDSTAGDHFGTNGIANLPIAVSSLAVQSDGKIVAAQSQAVRLLADGTLDLTFGAGGISAMPPLPFNAANDVAIQPDGRIVLAGDAGGAFGLVRFLGDAAPPLAAATTARPVQETLTATAIQPLLSEGLSRWQAAGADTSALHGIDVRIADLGETTLDLTSGKSVWLDDNAAGWSLFVDPTLGPPVGRRRKATSVPIEVMDAVFALGAWWPDVLMSNQPPVTLA